MPHQTLIWCCCLLLVQLATALTGDNVCKRVETSSETIEYVVTEPVTFRMYTWCLKIPPRCSKYATIMKERLKTKVNNHTIDFCCDEYVQMETYCVPKCSPTECPNMRCSSDKVCVCEPGFYGQRCHMPCRLGYFGENCRHKCICNGEPCDIVKGDCLPPITTTLSLVSSTTSLEGSRKATTPVNNLNEQISPVAPTLSTFTTQQIQSAISKKIEASEEENGSKDEDTDGDATVMPDGMSWDDIRTTLMPEDEVMIVYPITKPPRLHYTKAVDSKNARSTVGTTRVTQKYLAPSAVVTKVPYYVDKYKKPTTSKSDHQQEMYLEKSTPSGYPARKATTTQTKIADTVSVFKTMINNNFNTGSSKKQESPTDNGNNKHTRYHVDSSFSRKVNGLPPPVPDGSDNSLRLKGGDIRSTNISFTEEIDIQNTIRVASNELQRDTGVSTNYNYNKTNTETTINSSLVRAKWNSALDAIDFNSPSIIISTTVTIILSLILIVVMITRCAKKSKLQSTSFYDDNVKSCHENGLICSGHYTSPAGQPVFFCPAFTNSYAFELAQGTANRRK